MAASSARSRSTSIPAALQARGLSGQDVANTLAAQNLITPVGTAEDRSVRIQRPAQQLAAQIEDLGNLPIKTVNGAMVYIRDVASVRDGNPPQTNIVHVDGNRSVLMMVLKTGAISTLDIISGIKQKVVEVRDAMPEALKINFVGDQSVFVRGAISGVVKEGVIAACLTSLMILLFLGSWRSTVIIAISIPLSILGAIIMLSAIGETLNIMTLGGLALAVGILVDDATVTIENINWHLEQGKPVTQAILDGAQQIVTPAFVSLLCICIVFVPMFFLTGVARFLFVPMAEAVVFAMIGSFILSRTLVPTMANYLLKPHTHARPGDALPPTRNPTGQASSAVSRRASSGCAKGYHELLSLALGASQGVRRPASSPLSRCRSCWCRSSAATSSRRSMPARFSCMSRTQVGTRIEESRHPVRRYRRRRSARSSRRARSRRIVDNIGLPVSGINMTYINTGAIGPAGWRHPDQADARAIAPTADYVQAACASNCRRRFRASTFAFLPADIVSQILNFGSPAPIDVQVRGAESGWELRLCQQAAQPHPPHSRHRGCAHPAVAEQPDLRHRCRPHPRAICRPHRARRHQQPGRQSGRQLPGRADLLAQSRKRRVLSDRDADAAIPDRYAAGAAGAADDRTASRQSPDSWRHREHHAHDRDAVVSHYDIQPMVQMSTRPRRTATSARSPPTFSALLDRDRQGCAEGVDRGPAGQVQTMNAAFSGSAVRPAWRQRC